MKKLSVWLLAALAAALLAGCANQKAPAEQAVADATAALSAVREDAQKYAPDQLQAADEQLRSLKDSFANGDYRAVLTSAPTLTSSIRALKVAAEAKKADAQTALARAKDAWGSASTEVPRRAGEFDGPDAARSNSHQRPRVGTM